MLMLMPLKIDSSIAGRPAGVAGIFTITFGLFNRSNSRFASSIEPLVSFARVGLTSMLMNPSSPPVRSCTGRKMSAALEMSCRASSS